jgi:transcriptional regulator with XRE-family HTH domain
MGSSQPVSAVQIHAAALRAERRRQKLTQSELAEKTGLSLHYIAALERGVRTSPSLRTVMKLAAVLGVSYDVLAALTITHRELLQAIGGSGATALGSSETVGIDTLERLGTPAASAPKVNDVLATCDRLRAQGRWEAARVMGLDARSHFSAGSIEWSTITTEVCALMCQQAGDITGATRYLTEVEASMSDLGQEVSPEILGPVRFRHAWIYLEQLGDLNKAADLNASGMKLFRNCGDTKLERWSRHFRARIFCESYRYSNMFRSWQGARLREAEHGRILLEDYKESLRMIDEDIEGAYLLYRGFLSASVIGEYDSLNQVLKRSSIFKDHDARYFLHMIRLESSVRDGDFDDAIFHAKQAREGYFKVRSVFGVAISSALEAYAMMGIGCSNQDDKFRCLDLWALSILLHPYPGHYFYFQFVYHLKRAWQEFIDSEKAGLAYVLHLDERIQRGDGVFVGIGQLPKRLYGADYIRSLIEMRRPSH